MIGVVTIGPRSTNLSGGLAMSRQDDPGTLVAALYRAHAANDLDAMRDFLHPEVIWREHGGQAGYAGTHRGREAVLTMQ